MIGDLKPYAAMKDSGVPWLREAPEHWEVRKLRYVLRRVTERGRPDLPLLSVVREKGVILRDPAHTDENHNFIPDDLSNYRVVRVGQFVINKMKAWQGSYGVSRHDGIVSPAYFVFALAGVETRFAHSALRSRAYVPFFAQASDGVRIGQWDLAEARMREISLLVPPAREQATIVHLLDHIERRIQRYIRAKQKVIALLNEQKQGMIHHIVTRGLDSNVRRKSSGLEWLGAVPEHWEIRRNGQMFVQRNEMGFAELPILEVSLRTGVQIRDFGSSVRKQVMSDRTKYKRGAKGDIAYNMMRMWQGAGGVVPTDGLVSPAYIVATPREGIELRYFGHLFRTSSYMGEVDRYSRGIVKDRNRLYWEDFKQMPSPCPPTKEQAQIADAIDERTQILTEAIDQAECEIKLMREYRTRLVADVVTGKVDVREAAAKVPEEAEELELGEEVGAAEEVEDLEDEIDGGNGVHGAEA